MKTYKYTDSTHAVVHVIDEDGTSHASMLAACVPAGAEILPADTQPPVIPAVVSIYQACAALDTAGLLDDVEAYFASESATKGEKMAWARITEVRRDSPLMTKLSTLLGLTEAQVDALFVAAEAVTA